MLNFCSLYSGSSGNSLFVETQNTKLLVDAGVSCKKIENAGGCEVFLCRQSADPFTGKICITDA